MLNRAGVWFHTDLKDFEDVDFADYPHRLSTVLQGRVGMVRGRPQPMWMHGETRGFMPSLQIPEDPFII